MRIKRLYIGDFGIFRNTNMDDIGPGLVVIGGHNRSGKSTFMRVLRHLSYGFPRDSKLPPALREYVVEADILRDEDPINLRLRGFGKPSLSLEGRKLDGPLYGIDEFSYRELFTISLEQLYGELDLDRDYRRRLRALLIGAGFRDMLFIPKAKEAFASKAQSIGGKRGSFGVSQFKPYQEELERGIGLKDEGLSLVDDYRAKDKELEGTKITLKEAEEFHRDLEEEMKYLSGLLRGYDRYREIEGLDRELKLSSPRNFSNKVTSNIIFEVDGLIESFEKNYNNLDSLNLESAMDDDYRERILKEEENLLTLREEFSGYRERDIQQRAKVKRAREKLDSIEARVDRWGLEHRAQDLKNIELDDIDIYLVEDRLKKLKDKKDELVLREDKLKAISRLIDDDIEEKPNKGLKKLLTGFFLGFSGLTILGILLSLKWSTLGLFLGLGAIMALIFISVLRINIRKQKEEDLAIEALRKRDTRYLLEEEEIVLSRLKSEADELENLLSEDSRALGLPRRMPLDLIMDYISRLEDLKLDYLDYEGLIAEAREEGLYLSNRYDQYINLLERIDLAEDRLDDELYSLEGLKIRLDKTLGELKFAKEMELIEARLEADREKLSKISGGFDVDFSNDLSSEDLLRKLEDFSYDIKAFKAYEDKKERLKTYKGDFYMLVEESYENLKLKKAYEAYLEKEDLKNRINSERQREKEVLEKIEGLKKKGSLLERELDSLKATDRIAEGQGLVNRAREGLYPLAREYAINRAADFILAKAEEGLLEGIEDSLMDNAGLIFRRLTQEEYRGIVPSKDILEGDFHGVLDEDKSEQSFHMLSRGTAEQLYLSLRLSRIMDMGGGLPIIIDDSLVNFDKKHLIKALDIISELSKTNQVFILTCHRVLLEALDEINVNNIDVDYWKLMKGNFIKTEAESLKTYLG